MEAIATRDPIASRLEAIATRGRPLLVGLKPLLVVTRNNKKLLVTVASQLEAQALLESLLGPTWGV